MRRFRALISMTMVAVLTAAGVSSPAPAATPTPAAPGARFTIAVMPDTQFYARYADPLVADKYTPLWGSEPWQAQSHWIVNNAAKYNIGFTTHLGDLVDQVTKPGQWQQADKNMKILDDAKVPYSILPGNHDQGSAVLDGKPINYWSLFTAQRAAQDPTFLEISPSKSSRAHIFEKQGEKFLVLALGWATTSDFEWANNVIKAHPGMPTIVTSHQIINIGADMKTPLDTDFGNQLWDAVIAPNDQVFLTINGHHHGATQRVKSNAAGHPVVQVLMDYQMAYAGGNGNMGLIELDLTGGKISGTAFSPWVLTKPKETLNEHDQALLSGPGDQYSIDFDFMGRFAELKDAQANQADLTSALRQDFGAFTNPPVPTRTPAKNMDDYRKVEGTVAHWRVDPAKVTDAPLTDGAVVPEGGRMVDVAGEKDMTRQPVGALTTTGELGDVTVSSSHHPLSSDPWSVCFANSSRATNRTNFFATATGGRINEETFAQGYTFESFVKVDKSFSASDNKWMVAVGRAGDRKVIAPDGMVEGGEPPVALAMSNLAELQWSFMASQRPASDWGDGSAWSGDVDTERWVHVAVVNDPKTRETTMYLDGVPMLRSVSGLVGLEKALNGYWTIGGDSVPGVKTDHGWKGCVGETRIIDHPVPREQWLIERAAEEPTPTPTPKPTPTLTPKPTPTPTPTTPSITRGRVSIQGQPMVGKGMTATTQGFKAAGGVSFTYQWSRNGRPIPGAVGRVYTPTPQDYRMRLSVRVTAHAPGAPSIVQGSDETPAVGTIDKTAPSTGIMLRVMPGSTLVTLTARDLPVGSSQMGVASLSYRADGVGPVRTVSSSTATVVLPRGTHFITYWATDRVGNVEAKKTFKPIVVR